MSDGKSAIVRVSDGEVLRRFPVDARAMVACGEFQWESREETAIAEPASSGPLVVTRAEDAAPAAPVQLPRGRRAKG